MVLHHRTTRGTDVFALGMPNSYANRDSDLGPTWCYLIAGRETILIDTGRFGNVETLLSLLHRVGKDVGGIDRVMVTHCHEDHDGNLSLILERGRARFWAHPIYRSMITRHPHILDGAIHPDWPGSCRNCQMPESFAAGCLSFMEPRSRVRIDVTVGDDTGQSDDELRFIFTPGHAPDSMCVLLENEVLFTGDTVLPDITPHPSREYNFKVNRRILPPEYQDRNTVYGLLNLLRSLHRIGSFDTGLAAVFPGHRMFHNGRFNLIDSVSQRASEIVRFHVERCRDIVDVVSEKSLSVDEITKRHFPPSRLRGTGIMAARSEILAHLEVLESTGDVRRVEDLFQSTGSSNYVAVIEALLPRTAG